MVTNNGIKGILASGWLRRGTAWYLVAYLLMQRSGFFGLPYAGIIPIVHRWPALVGIIVLMAGSAASLITWWNTEGRAGRSFSRVLLHCGLLIAGAGVLISSLTRFEGSLVLAEGQAGRTMKESLDPSGVYAKRFSSWPEEDLAVVGVAPFFSEKGKPLWRRRAEVLFRDVRNPQGRPVMITSTLPSLVNGFFYRIGSVGYSPHFMLFDGTGAVINDAYAVMDLYPPGAEDFFRVFDIPHTFYVRYYPDASMVPDNAGQLDGKAGPRYKVRVARNLDLLMDRYVSPFEMLPLDKYVFSFQDAARWVEIQIVRDYGIFLVIPGVIMAMFGALAPVVGKLRGGRRERDAAHSA